MEIIAIQVDAEVAKAYQAAEPQKQQKIQTIVNDWLKLIIQEKSLDEIIAEMQEQAKNKGLTQEYLPFHQPDQITQQLDAVYADEDSSIDPLFVSLQAHTISEENFTPDS
ncbi:hypothetical protein [Sphaerospermopsis aphanizomenoides]|uniref:hypothetical protein n=1 Tax=Sphaerospermopsis aphanizomenoides TaxID=459663 RepID=UPI001F4743F8|nr:hypothetical protein [Sphaerospermopsis aphanizomenoides]